MTKDIKNATLRLGGGTEMQNGLAQHVRVAAEN